MADRRLSALRRAAEAGNLAAACELGEVLAARGQQSDAVEWWRIAQRQGHPRATHHVAVWLKQQGDVTEAEQLWLQAAKAGENDAACELGQLLAGRGDMAGAHRWLTAAVDAGSARGAFHLGGLCEAKGDLEAAQRWYHSSAERGHRAAAVAFGVLLASEDERRWDEYDFPLPGEAWWERAIEGLDAGSARELGQLLGWDSDIVEDEHWLRVTYEAGDPMAAYWLGRLLEERHWRYSKHGWNQEAEHLFDSVRKQTDYVSRILHDVFRSRRRSHYLSTGRVPSGLDPSVVCAYGYASVRCGKLHGRDEREYFRSMLIRDHEDGDTEATFLLGKIEHPSTHTREVERWFQLAAEAGHGQAAYELAVIRENSNDHCGAIYWYRRAAEEGHPGGMYELAQALRSTDRATAEAECRKAAQAGCFPAAVLLRFLHYGGGSADHQATPRPEPDDQPEFRATGFEGASPDATGIVELLSLWDELKGLAPDPNNCVDYLATRAGLPRSDVARVRKIRNRCAHPADRGRPSTYNVNVALTVARELRRRLTQ